MADLTREVALSHLGAPHQTGHSKRVKAFAIPRAAGGKGSGNFGHAGRPGEQGGSASGSESAVNAAIDHLYNKYPVNPDNFNERLVSVSGRIVGDFEVTERDGRLRIRSIQSKEPGAGTLILSRILRAADINDVTIELTASSKGSHKLSTDDLKLWYGRHGFVPEHGFDPALGYMIREPKRIRSAEWNEADHPRGDDGKWSSGEGVTDGDVADASIHWAATQYPRANLTIRKAKGLEPNEKMYKGSVDGLAVRAEIPNTDSISATFGDSSEYDELPGIREVSLSEFDTRDYHSKGDQDRAQKLADKIKESGEISPLIVVVDGTKKPYVLEGGHRLSALQLLGKSKFPAVVIVDHRETK